MKAQMSKGSIFKKSVHPNLKKTYSGIQQIVVCVVSAFEIYTADTFAPQYDRGEVNYICDDHSTEDCQQRVFTEALSQL